MSSHVVRQFELTQFIPDHLLNVERTTQISKKRPSNWNELKLPIETAENLSVFLHDLRDHEFFETMVSYFKILKITK
jgi:hypothetical protein